MIHDNWSVHKTDAFKRTANELNIELYPIPTSAPYYNKIEQRLFGMIQKDVLNGSNFNDIDELKEAIIDYVDEEFNSNAYHQNRICLNYTN